MPTNDDDSDDETAWTPPPDLSPAQLVDWQQARAHVLLGQAFRSLGRNVNEQTNVIRPLVEREVGRDGQGRSRRADRARTDGLDARGGPVLASAGLSTAGRSGRGLARGPLVVEQRVRPSAPPRLRLRPL